MRQPITNREIALSRDWCIAGGFAACPSLAGDCDVWVLDANDDIREPILRQLQFVGVEFTPEENSPPDSPENIDQYDLGNGTLCWKVARLADGRQIILTSAPDIMTQLGAFDVSTHQVALTSDGEVIRGPNWTPITVPPVELRSTSKSAERMKKIATRYATCVKDQSV